MAVTVYEPQCRFNAPTGVYYTDVWLVRRDATFHVDRRKNWLNCNRANYSAVINVFCAAAAIKETNANATVYSNKQLFK